MVFDKPVCEPYKPDISHYQPVTVNAATCGGCPAGQNGGLCQHVFAALIAAERYRQQHHGKQLPGKESMTSRRQSWGPHTRDVELKPVFQLIYEKSKMGDERKPDASGPRLFETQGPELRDISDEDALCLRSSLARCTVNARMHQLIHLPTDK